MSQIINVDLTPNDFQPILNYSQGDGLAIGFTVSHWYAHLVLSFIDRKLKENQSNVFLVRYMDNYVLLCRRKKSLMCLLTMLLKHNTHSL